MKSFSIDLMNQYPLYTSALSLKLCKLILSHKMVARTPVKSMRAL